MTPTEMHIDALMEEALKKADELHEFEIEKYREVIEILKAENARYREALEWIVSNQHLIIFADNETHAKHFTAKVREALKGE